MTLATGSKLGPYEITGALGAGGMRCSRARDAKLCRDVALKFVAEGLPAMLSAWSASACRSSRFVDLPPYPP